MFFPPPLLFFSIPYLKKCCRATEPDPAGVVVTTSTRVLAAASRAAVCGDVPRRRASINLWANRPMRPEKITNCQAMYNKIGKTGIIKTSFNITKGIFLFTCALKVRFINNFNHDQLYIAILHNVYIIDWSVVLMKAHNVLMYMALIKYINHV